MKRVVNLMLVIALILTSVSTAFVYAADETVTAIAMEGLLNVGQTLEITYTCENCEELQKNGALDGAVYKWYAATAADGEFALIDGANTYNYTLTEAELNEFIKAELIVQGKTFTAVSSDAVGEKGANLALGKGCRKLSTSDTYFSAPELKLDTCFDGERDPEKRFAATGEECAKGRYVTADFGTKATYNKVLLTFRIFCYKNIKLEASDDGENWFLVDTYTDNRAFSGIRGEGVALSFPQVSSRYLRAAFSDVKEGGEDGIQLCEFEVYNAEKSGNANLALGKASEKLSHVGLSDFEAAKATDGDYSGNSRFAPNGFGDNKYFTVDFGDFEAFNTIATYFFDGADYVYDVKVSNDANTWRTVAANQSTHGGADGPWRGEAEVIAFDTVTARYLRLDFTNHKGVTPAIFEFEVYNRSNEVKELTGKDDNIALGKLAYFNRCVDSTDNWKSMVDKIQYICDGKKDTFLSFGKPDGWPGNAYVVYDLFDIYKINKAVITEKSGEKNITNYMVETSLDGITWNKVFAGSKKGVNSAIARFRDASARFVRIEILPDSKDVNLAEVELYYENNGGNLAYQAADPSRSTVYNHELFLPASATDGDYNSFWIGEEAENPVLTLNFGTPVDFNTLVVSEVDRGGSYVVEYSADGASWTKIEGLTGSNIDNTPYVGSNGRASIFAFDTVNAQFLRLNYTKNKNADSTYASEFIRVREIEVYNMPNRETGEISGTNLALGKNVYLHDGRNNDFKNITDGNAATGGTIVGRWDGGQPYVLIDLENKTTFNRINLTGDKNITKVETSNDGITWKSIFEGSDKALSLAKETARFVKISVENGGSKINEIEISLAEKYAVKSVDTADGKLNAINIEKGRDAAEYEGENLKAVIGIYSAEGMLIETTEANTADIADGKLTLSKPVSVVSGQKIRVFIFNSLDNIMPVTGKFETTVE